MQYKTKALCSYILDRLPRWHFRICSSL